MCSKTKALISFAVTAKLICVFVFAYAKSWCSHDAVEASVVYWLSHLPSNPGVVSSIPGFSSLSDETLNQGPVSV